MITCRLCGQETEKPCGPLRGPVCPSCWLAVGDDFLCEHAPDLESAIEWANSRISVMSELEFLNMTPDSVLLKGKTA